MEREGDIFDSNTPKVLAILLLYSAAMFTFPFVSFYCTKHYMDTVFNVQGFANTCWSVTAAVLTVWTIILVYAYQGFCEDAGVAMQNVGVAVQDQDTASRKTELNLKED